MRIHKQVYGKGPTKGRTHLRDDLLTVLLHGGFTRPEQTLHAQGHDQLVIESRLLVRSAAQDAFHECVEALVQRPVRSSMGAFDVAGDLQVELFVLGAQSEELRGSAAGLIDRTRSLQEGNLAVRAEKDQARRRAAELRSEAKELRGAGREDGG